MKDKYLIINAGSSSLKFSLYEMPSEKELINGYVEKIGFEDSFWNVKINGTKKEDKAYLKDHSAAVEVMVDELLKNRVIKSMDEIKCVGHRVLHGGEYYSDSVIIDDTVLDRIISLTNLGPLHHPGEIAGIKAMKEYMPNTPQVAVFDTAFHQTMPKVSYMYAVPYDWYTEYKVRKYGFHGTSHKYITTYMQGKLNKETVNLIICHVGSGASVSCIRDGKCYDTSMGLTPLDGLIMGTRSGQIDSSIINFMVSETGRSVEEITNDLNKKSGLLGICGKNDFRDLRKLVDEGNERAQLAYDMFMDSIIKHIAEYYFELEGEVDVINLVSKPMGVYLDKEANDNIGYGHELKEGIITSDESKIPFYVVPTNEEVMILRDCEKIVKGA